MRGFLWGYLRQAGWKEIWIWLFQAALWAVGHAYNFPYAPALAVLANIAIAGLVFGWLAWRSRTIASSMAAHATGNALGYTAGYLAAWLRLGPG